MQIITEFNLEQQVIIQNGKYKGFIGTVVGIKITHGLNTVYNISIDHEFEKGKHYYTIIERNAKFLKPLDLRLVRSIETDNLIRACSKLRKYPELIDFVLKYNNKND
jgi:hypothetical protein